jgi:hypothetical protein
VIFYLYFEDMTSFINKILGKDDDKSHSHSSSHSHTSDVKCEGGTCSIAKSGSKIHGEK